MRSILRKLRRSPVPQTSKDNDSKDNNPPRSGGRQNRFRLSARSGLDDVPNMTFDSAIKPLCESPVTPTRSRKRDRLKNYLSRRREGRTKGSLPYWPSTDKEELRSSDDTEDGDDVYMVDFYSDSDSDDDSIAEDDYIAPPVAIPEMYRRQDRQGGITVAGARVLFTYAGFKRRQMMLQKLQAVPELDPLDAPMGLHQEFVVIGAY